MSLATKIERLIRKGITDAKTLRKPPANLNAGYTTASKAYVYTILKSVRRKEKTKALPETTPFSAEIEGTPKEDGTIIEPSVTIGYKEITVPEEALTEGKEPTDGISPEITDQVSTMVSAGQATKTQVASLFKAVNKWLEPYAPDDETASLCAEVWVTPFNRLLGKVSEGNEDLIIAGMVTMAVYSYPIYAKVNDFRKTRGLKKKIPKSKQEKIKEELGRSTVNERAT